jgi:hypothetical protein
LKLYKPIEPGSKLMRATKHMSTHRQNLQQRLKELGPSRRYVIEQNAGESWQASSAAAPSQVYYRRV